MRSLYELFARNGQAVFHACGGSTNLHPFLCGFSFLCGLILLRGDGGAPLTKEREQELVEQVG